MLEVILRIGSYLFVLKSMSLADEEQDLDVEEGATLKFSSMGKQYLPSSYPPS